MTRDYLRRLIGLFGAGVLFGAPAPALAEIQVPAVLDAIRQEYCIWEYWVPSPPAPSESLPVTVRLDGDIAYAWVEFLQNPKNPWVMFYAVTGKGGKATVTTRDGYNPSVMQANRGYLETRNKVFGDDWAKHTFGVEVHKAELKRPFKCVRVFEPDTPAKLDIIEGIQKSMEWRLPRSKYAARLPERVRIVIGNFNVEDGHTYVAVRGTNALYGVTLDRAWPAGPYIVWDPPDASEAPQIRSKVLETGIEREIRVGK